MFRFTRCFLLQIKIIILIISQTDKPKKPKYVYKTAEEIKAGGIYKRKKEVTPSELTKVKVIDMTGKEQRVMSGEYK